ncbi:protein of unknown function [Paraburkholderia dioscoreae]|uniref:Uncharacterized protein n=1 Tax=Paraburkholderia dioscoreae TaxID=2604047 RepID=A0A5Q4ZBT7_9BURK|nr:protein of unknown function [Paraburkholderia dioscoreae]
MGAPTEYVEWHSGHGRRRRVPAWRMRLLAPDDRRMTAVKRPQSIRTVCVSGRRNLVSGMAAIAPEKGGNGAETARKAPGIRSKP